MSIAEQKIHNTIKIEQLELTLVLSSQLYLLGCIQCMKCGLLLLMIVVSVILSRMHRMTPAGFHCVGTFGAAFAKLLWPLVIFVES